MHFFLLGLVVLIVLLLAARFIPPLFRTEDPRVTAAALDRDGAHEMLERHLHYMVMAIVLPGHFQSGEGDAAAATAAMMRIMEIEGEPPDAETARAFVDRLVAERAEEATRDGKYPPVFDDMWPL